MVNIILEDGLKYLGSRLALSLIAFAGIPVIIGIFGIETYGEYSLVIALITMLQVAFFGALNQGYLRHKDVIRNTSFLVSITLKWVIYSLPLGVLLLTITTYYKLGAIGQFVSVYLAFSTFAIYSSFRLTHQSDRRIYENFIAEAVRIVSFLLLAVMSFYFFGTESLQGILLCFILGNILYAVISIGLRRVHYDLSSEIGIYYLLRYGYPIAIWATLAAFMTYMDRYLVGLLFDKSILGLYSAYSDVVVRFGALFMIPLSTAILPAFLVDENVGAIVKSKLYFIVIWLACLIVSLLFVYLLDFTTIALFGEKGKLFENRFDYLALFFGLFLWQSSILTHKYLEINKKSHVIAINIVLCLMIHYAAIYFLVDGYGVAAFSYASVMSSITYMLLSYLGTIVDG